MPTLALVENMAFFDGDDGKRYFPFGRSLLQRSKVVASEHDIAHVIRLPIDPEATPPRPRCVPLPGHADWRRHPRVLGNVQVSESAESGTPVVVAEAQRRERFLRALAAGQSEQGEPLCLSLW